MRFVYKPILNDRYILYNKNKNSLETTLLGKKLLGVSYIFYSQLVHIFIWKVLITKYYCFREKNT
jgi:hypothetical protein